MNANPAPLFPTELHAGVEVRTSDDQKVGDLHRVVLRRADLSVTHVVVDVGFLRSGKQLLEGGLGLEYDRILPIRDVAEANSEIVRLTLTQDQFVKQAEQYTESSYEEPQDMSPGEFDLPDVVNRIQALSAMVGSTSNMWLVESLKTPPGGVDVVEGTPVWRHEPHTKIGEVQRILMDETTGRAKAFVVKRGWLLHHEAVLSTRFISDMAEDMLYVDITDAEIDQLPEFKEDS